MRNVASARPTCANGHPMLNGRRFCPDCGTPGVSTTPPPPQSADHPAADRPTQADIPFVLLVVGAVVALIVVFVLMFTTPHATFDGNVNDGGNVAQGTISTSCITAWDNMVRNFSHPSVPSGTYELYVSLTFRIALVGLVHGRQHLAILFLVVAVGLGIGASFRYRADGQPGCNCKSVITSAHQAVGPSYSDRILGADFSSSSAVTMSGNRQSKDRYGS